MTEDEFLEYMDTVPTLMLTRDILWKIQREYDKTSMSETTDVIDYLVSKGRLHHIKTNDGLIYRIMKPYMDDEKSYSGLLTEDD